MTTTDTRCAPRISRRTKMTAVVSAAVAFLAMIATAPATASWSASASATATVTAPSVSVVQSGFAGLGTTVPRSTAGQTGGFTVTNTGGIAGTASLRVSATGDAAAGMRVHVWSAVSIQACASEAMPPSAFVGTWAEFPVIPEPTLQPGGSITYCVRSVTADPEALANASGAKSMTVTATAQLSAGRWSVSTPASATFSTKAIYPLGMISQATNQNNWMEIRSVAAAGLCVDVYSSGTSAGNVVGLWSCALQSNQRFEIYPTGNGQSGIRSRVGAEISIGQTANATVLARPGASDTNWRVERVTANSFQLVHADTQLCMTANASVQITLSVCNDSVSQQFTLTRDPLTCSASGANISLRFNSPPTNRPYTVQNRVGSGTWTSVYTTSPLTSAVYTLTRSMFLAGDANLDVRVIDGAGNVLYSGMTAATKGTAITCGTGFA